MILGQFVSTGSCGAQSLIYSSADNRVKIANTHGKEISSLVEKNHLDHSYSCIAVSSHSSSSGKQLLSVGCSDGSIVVWSLERGVIAHVFGVRSEDGESMPLKAPTDMSFSCDGSSLFVADGLGPVREYSMESGDIVSTHKLRHKKSSESSSVTDEPDRILCHPSQKIVAISGR